MTSKLLKAGTEPRYVAFARNNEYGATPRRDGSGLVDLYVQTIRGNKVHWRHAGVAKWSDKFGLYNLPSFVNEEIRMALEFLLEPKS